MTLQSSRFSLLPKTKPIPQRLNKGRPYAGRESSASKSSTSRI